MRARPHDPLSNASADISPPFVDRYDAGERLAAAARAWLPQRGVPTDELIIVGVTDGGLPLAYLVSLELGVEVEPAPVEPLHAPHQKSLRIGMLVDDGHVYVDQALGDRHGARGTTLDHLIDRAELQLWRQMDALGDEPGARVMGLDVLLVDDVVDTGLTIVSCADWLRRWGARSVYAAVAVGSESGVERAAAQVDGMLCLHTVEDDVPPGALFVHPAEDDVAENSQLMEALRLLNARHRSPRE